MHSMYGIDPSVALSPQSGLGRTLLVLVSGSALAISRTCGLFSPGPSPYHRTGTSNIFFCGTRLALGDCADTGSLPAPRKRNQIDGSSFTTSGECLIASSPVRQYTAKRYYYSNQADPAYAVLILGCEEAKSLQIPSMVEIAPYSYVMRLIFKTSSLHECRLKSRESGSPLTERPKFDFIRGFFSPSVPSVL